MKTSKPLFALLFFCMAFELFAQNPLVGTWRLLSAKGIEPDGKKYAYDNSQTNQLILITPTHWMYINEKLGKGFEHAAGGTYVLNRNKYIETVTTASWEGYEQNKTGYTWKVEGDLAYIDGTLTLADGGKYQLHEVWQKVASPQRNGSDKSTGAWQQLTSHSTDANGKQSSSDHTKEKELFLLTPTHWMFIREEANTKKFISAGGGSYTREGSTVLPKTEVASWKHDQQDKIEIAYQANGDQLVEQGRNSSNHTTWTSTYHRANAKGAKTASAK